MPLPLPARRALAVLLVALAGPALAQDADGWTSLLDEDLSAWRTYLSFRHQPGYDGWPPVGPDGQPLAPVG